MDDSLRQRWYIGWACTEKTPLQEQVQIAVAHFQKRHGRPPAVVAVHEKDGLTPPEGVELIAAEWVPKGYIRLYL